ncbi:MAG: response regulator [Anaerolineae bacterium]|nr:response regulator [Anaerolineae bacterium]
MTNSAHRDTILIVARDQPLREVLSDLLKDAGGYQTSLATNFEDALDQILLFDFTAAIIEVRLSGLSGIDLLTAVGVLCPHMSVILIDDDLSAKSAVAAFRLGAADYLSKPINLDFLLMRIDREIRLTHPPPPPPPTGLQKHYTPRDRERRLNPMLRPAALILKRAHFEQISDQLTALHQHVRANFVGLVDVEENLIGAVGTLEDCDLMLLKTALTFDHSAAKSLLNVLGETSFHSTRFEGEHCSVYVTEFGHPNTVTLVIICSVDVKAGIAWHYSRRTVVAIDKIIKSAQARKYASRLKSS